MIIDHLSHLWKDTDYPFYLDEKSEFYFQDLMNIQIDGIENIKNGDVVSLISDFSPEGIFTLLSLLEKKAIVVPLTLDTKNQHSYFFENSRAQYIFTNNKLTKVISEKKLDHPLLEKIRIRESPGLILFTTGTTGRPKAILHDFQYFISRYKTPRPSLKSLSFLLFDHIGGINTLLHMLFNKGTVISIKERSVDSVLKTCTKYNVELLPTTPTFLRLLSLTPNIKKIFPKSIKIVSYGTERMDQPTLNFLNKELDNVEFRQTYGMSELGILRVKSFKSNSLFMKVGGEGVETKILNNILYIKAKNRMIGYLNAKSPFDNEGWYCTNDIVESKDDEFFKIVGRNSDVINVGGLKFMPSEIERITMMYPKEGILFAKAYGGNNPITGQHVELKIQVKKGENVDKKDLSKFLKSNLQKHMMPMKIILMI